MTDAPETRPNLQLMPGRHKRAKTGHPWVYSNEIVMDPAAKALPPGGLVTLRMADGRPMGVATFNPRPLVGARILDREADQPVDTGFLAGRLRQALALRERLFDRPFYRLIHAEADRLPGLIIDRYGDAVVCQLNTAGMALLEPELMAALEAVLAPRLIVLRNDSAARTLEGLEPETRIVKGELDGALEVEENGARFLADLGEGQKTGWFFDQRENRAFMAGLSAGRRVLDAYCFTGGFGVLAAVAGAADVLAIDRSESALDLANRAAALNGVTDRFRTQRGEAFQELERLRDKAMSFDIVIVDPPAFAKSKKEVPVAVQGYRKLVRLAARLVAPGGVLFAASCSHNVDLPTFAEAVRQGLADADREGRILRTSGAASDHPVHPALPESAYLKAEIIALD